MDLVFVMVGFGFLCRSKDTQYLVCFRDNELWDIHRDMAKGDSYVVFAKMKRILIKRLVLVFNERFQ
jgi:hypothetical protein